MELTAATGVTVIRIDAGDEASAHKSRLALRAQRGDREAFGQLYESHAQRIYGVCLQILGDPEDAADAASEAFVKAMEHIGSLRDPSAFSGWLCAIARNLAFSRITERQRTCQMPSEIEAEVPDRRTGSDPAIEAERRETSNLLTEAAETLNPRYRQVYDLHLRKGWDADRLAGTLGVTTAHAYVLVSRVKEALREGLRAVVMARQAKTSCGALQAIASEFGKERSPRMRQAILRHVRGCERCSARVHPALMSSR
jgi:RNA polymerase sigma factor (sigma-70 family)